MENWFPFLIFFRVPDCTTDSGVRSRNLFSDSVPDFRSYCPRSQNLSVRVCAAVE